MSKKNSAVAKEEVVEAIAPAEKKAVSRKKVLEAMREANKKEAPAKAETPKQETPAKSVKIERLPVNSAVAGVDLNGEAAQAYISSFLAFVNNTTFKPANERGRQGGTQFKRARAVLSTFPKELVMKFIYGK